MKAPVINSFTKNLKLTNTTNFHCRKIFLKNQILQNIQVLLKLMHVAIQSK